MGACCGVLTSETGKEDATTTPPNKTSTNISVDVTEVRVSNAEQRTKSISTASPTGRISVDGPPLTTDFSAPKPNPLVTQMKVKRNFSMDEELDAYPKTHQNDPDRAILANQLSIAHNLSKLNRRPSRDSPVGEIVEALYDMKDQKPPVIELPPVRLPTEPTVA